MASLFSKLIKKIKGLTNKKQEEISEEIKKEIKTNTKNDKQSIENSIKFYTKSLGKWEKIQTENNKSIFNTINKFRLLSAGQVRLKNECRIEISRLNESIKELKEELKEISNEPVSHSRKSHSRKSPSGKSPSGKSHSRKSPSGKYTFRKSPSGKSHNYTRKSPGSSPPSNKGYLKGLKGYVRKPLYLKSFWKKTRTKRSIS